MKFAGFAVLGIVVGSTLTLTACGHDCGKGTENSNGECVVTEITCGEGTTLVDGRCVAGITGCGAFTRFDATTGRCVPSEANCGTGTQLDEATGACVPSTEVSCGSGTIQVGTTCVVDPSVLCPAGLVDAGSGCVPGGFVQVIHNSPDPAAADIGLFINGTRFVNTVGSISNDRVAYRTATRFLPIAEGDVSVVVTDPAATDDSTAIVGTTITLSAGARTILVIDGVLNPSAFTGAVQAIGISQVGPALAASDAGDPAGSFRLAFFQGAPDASAMTFNSFLDGVGAAVGYGAASSYLVLPAGVRAFDISGAGPDATLQTSSATTPLTSGFAAGNAALALTSGFVTTQASAPTRTFAAVAALPEGGALRILDQAARTQVAHAAVGAGNVDVFVNSARVATNVAVHTATSFFAVPSGALTLALGATGDDEAGAPIARALTLAPGDVFAFIASSVTAGAGPGAPERLLQVAARTHSVTSSAFSVAVAHAVSDAGAVILRDSGGTAVGSGTPISYSQATGYTDAAPGTVPFDFFAVDGSESRLASVQSSGSGLASSAVGVPAGQAFIVVATGLAASLELHALTPDGSFATLDRAARVQFINAVQAREAPSIDLLLNASPLQTSWPLRSALAYRTYALVNDALPVSVQPAGDATLRVTRNVDFTGVPGDLVYVVTLLGARANAGTNDLFVFPTPGRETSRNSAEVAVNNFNGLSDLSPFDVGNAATGALLFDDCDYGSYGRAGYIQMTPDTYVFQLSDPDSNPPFIQYYALDVDFSSLAGQAVVVVETGFNAPGSGEPAFGAIGVLADGTVLNLPTL